MKRLTSLAISLLIIQGAWGIPARPGICKVAQPDGTTIDATLSGDENNAVYRSPDGGLLEPDGNGWLHTVPEVEKHATGSFAKHSLPHRAGGKINNYPTTGKQEVLVILAEFSDLKFRTGNPRLSFDNMLNQAGYSENGATGSARDYFIDNSAGAYRPHMTVAGPYTLPHSITYYGAQTETANDAHADEMIADACRLADSDIDFSKFDYDGDGTVDNVYIFYAGYSQADGAGANFIWPHSSMLHKTMHLSLDSVTVDRYACSNEVEFSSGKQASIGTFCHEFSHVLGLPDLYATDYSSDAHPGTWSIMASGAYNNNGRTPPALSACERYFLGWLEPDQLDSATGTTHSLEPISHNKAFKIRATDPDEYFIIENRHRSGWDSYIEDEGLLAWHIHFIPSRFSGNSVNNDPAHQLVDLLEADNNPGSPGLGEAFGSFSDNNELSDITTPSLVGWDNSKRGFGLFNIRPDSLGKMLFETFRPDDGLTKVTGVTAANTTPVSFELSWNATSGATGYIIDIFKTEDNKRVYAPGYKLKNVETTAISVNGLEPETDYKVRIRPYGNNGIGSYCDEVTVRTLEKDFRFAVPQAASATEVHSTSFTANWLEMQEAVEYNLYLYENISGGLYTEGCDFSEGSIAEGWTASPTASFSEWYFGESAPSMALGGDGLTIQSPRSGNRINSISFWHRASSNHDDDNSLVVSGYNGAVWENIAAVNPLAEKPGETVSVDLSSGESSYEGIRITYHRPVSGTVYIDDIVLEREKLTTVPLTGYNPANAGNNLSLKITGLKPGTLYSYCVSASNGTLTSGCSPLVTVKTPGTENSIETLCCNSDSNIRIFTMSGILIYHGTEIPTLLPGVYIMQRGDKTDKLSIR